VFEEPGFTMPVTGSAERLDGTVVVVVGAFVVVVVGAFVVVVVVGAFVVVVVVGALVVVVVLGGLVLGVVVLIGIHPDWQAVSATSASSAATGAIHRWRRPSRRKKGRARNGTMRGLGIGCPFWVVCSAGGNRTQKTAAPSVNREQHPLLGCTRLRVVIT
jgi:hypothetical protein